MPPNVSLRPVTPADFPVFFAHQLDPEATRMAAFPPRERDAFMAHWTKITADAAKITRAILVGNDLAGNIGAWTDDELGERLVGYWIGREFWGKGVASAALRQFLHLEKTRPLTARVARHNLGSLRVLEKCGFARAGEDSFSLPDGTSHGEFIYTLTTD